MRQPARVGISVLLLVGALTVLHLRSSGEAVPIRQSLASFPMAVDQWRGREGTVFEPDILNLLKVKDYLVRPYQDRSGHSLWLFIGYWDSQRRGAQPHSPKNCLPGGGWEPLDASTITIPMSSPFAPITVNRYLIQKDQEQQVVLYWYQSQGRATAGEVAARIEMVKNSITNHRTDGALVRVSSLVQGGARETTDRLAKFIESMYPKLSEYLPD